MEYYFHDYRIDFDKKHSSNVRMAEAQQEYSFSSKIVITDNYFVKLKTTARSTKKTDINEIVRPRHRERKNHMIIDQPPHAHTKPK